MDADYDVVVVGAGVTGALMAKQPTQAGLRVLVLEAGPATADLRRLQRHVRRSSRRRPRAPSRLGGEPRRPAPRHPRLPTPTAATSSERARPYGSTATRARRAARRCTGWACRCGCCRRTSSCARATASAGLAARLRRAGALLPSAPSASSAWPPTSPTRRTSGVTFRPGYDYPMQRIPPSYSDAVLAEAADGMEVTVGGERIAVKIRSYPAGSQLDPARRLRPVGAVDDASPDGQALGRDLGQRCAGNTACIPICPIQAKYNALKSLARPSHGHLRCSRRPSARRSYVDPAAARCTSIEYQRYDGPRLAARTRSHRVDGASLRARRPRRRERQAHAASGPGQAPTAGRRAT